MLADSNERGLEERLGEEAVNVADSLDRLQTQDVAALSLMHEMFAGVDVLGTITTADSTMPTRYT
jgi:hypothetical protein